MKNILILTDFSDHAAHAMDYACNLANVQNSETVTLLNTYEIIPIYDSGEGGTLALTMQQTEELENSRKEELARLAETVKSKLKPGITVNSLLMNSSLISAVNEICEERNIDLVVMGIKIKDDLEQILLGSNAHKAIDKIQYPVLIVPKNAPVATPQKVILATDFYEANNNAAFLQLKKYLGKLKAPVLAVHKYKSDENRSSTSSLANVLQQQLNEYDCEVEYLEPEANLPESLNKIANEYSPSIIISIHKKRGFFERLFHKSTTKALAWHSGVAVLVLHVE